MIAPIIDNFIARYRNTRYSLDGESTRIINELFACLARLEPCGDDERHELWLRAERGTIEDFGDYDTFVEDEIVETREQFNKCWLENYPEEYSWYRLITVEYNDYRTVMLNGEAVVQLSPDDKGWEHDVSEPLQQLLNSVEAAVEMIAGGTYNDWIEKNLSYKYRRGTIPVKDFWNLYPKEKEEHQSIISDEECRKFADYLRNPNADMRLSEMTVERYLDICKLGYVANKLKGTESLSALELFKRYADDRNGGLLTLPRSSPEAFEKWFGLSHEEKWQIDNPSHIWEVIQGSSRTRIHLNVNKDIGGYWLSVSSNEYCCPEYAVRIYNALRDNDIPVSIYNGERISRYLNGDGKVGIVPCFENPSDYFYGGFSDKEVGEFTNLPDNDAELLIQKVSWEPLKKVLLRKQQIPM